MKRLLTPFLFFFCLQCQQPPQAPGAKRQQIGAKTAQKIAEKKSEAPRAPSKPTMPAPPPPPATPAPTPPAPKPETKPEPPPPTKPEPTPTPAPTIAPSPAPSPEPEEHKPSTGSEGDVIHSRIIPLENELKKVVEHQKNNTQQINELKKEIDAIRGSMTQLASQSAPALEARLKNVEQQIKALSRLHATGAPKK